MFNCVQFVETKRYPIIIENASFNWKTKGDPILKEYATLKTTVRVDCKNVLEVRNTSLENLLTCIIKIRINKVYTTDGVHTVSQKVTNLRYFSILISSILQLIFNGRCNRECALNEFLQSSALLRLRLTLRKILDSL